MTYLNIGCGKRKIAGFTNIDLEGDVDLRIDVRRGLPFDNGSVQGIYSEHFIEHLTQSEAVAFLRECRRVLRVEGRLRIATPDLASIVGGYLNGEWKSQADELVSFGINWIANRAELLNVAMREWGHQWLYDEEELTRLSAIAGLRRLGRCELGASTDPMMRNLEYREASRLICEFGRRLPDSSKEPLVSIVIPAYNPRYFRECLLSAIKQTYHHTEIVVCDDSLTDGIKAIVEEFLADGRIRYFKNERNIGAIANYVKSFELSRGDYIKFLNDDDVLHPECVSRMVMCLTEFPEVTLVTSHRQRIDEKGETLLDTRETLRPVPTDSLIEGVSLASSLLRTGVNFIGEPTTVMFRRCDIEDTEPNIVSFGNRECLAIVDMTMWVNLLSKGDAVYLMDTLSSFRIHPEQGQRQPSFFPTVVPAVSQLRFDAERMGFSQTEAESRLKTRALKRPSVSFTAAQGEADSVSDAEMRPASSEPGLPRLIAFYLPQYHPIPENDTWWGRGFTEWTNVTKAAPLFPGHYQPHMPADLGFYDLRLPETRKAQADLARQHGIYGFCYYHYWFGGRRLLNRPLDEVLATGQPDFPFCLCWANEDWTRAWDGRSGQVLLKQEYSEKDDIEHIRFLCNVFQDSRYIRIDGKPLFLVYRARKLPDPLRTTTVWREEVRKMGIGDIYLCRVESCRPEKADHPVSIGFDAAVEFQPDWDNLGEPDPQMALQSVSVYKYEDVADRMSRKPAPDYRRFPCVTPSWDNSARRKRGSVVLHGSTPAIFEGWLRRTLDTFVPFSPEENVVFINAWNEWAEGNHLEPDSMHGWGYLEAVKSALNRGGRQGERSTTAVEFVDRCESLYRKALSLYKPDSPDEAEGVLRSIVSAFPGFAPAFHDLGIIARTRQNRNDARDLLERAVALQPDNIVYLKSLAEYYFIDEGNIGNAIKLYTRVIVFNPEDKETLLVLGNLSALCRQFEHARDFYQMALTLDAHDEHALKNLELLEAMESHSAGAVVEERPASKRDPDAGARQVISDRDNDSPLKHQTKSETVASEAREITEEDTGRSLSSGLFSIVILTYNEVDYTKRCLRSIRQHTPEPHEIIFVDNGSTDGTVKWLKKKVAENSNYRLMVNATNLGFAKGSNQGIVASHGEYVLLLNNDVVVTERWLAGLRETLDTSLDTGIVGPMTNNISGIQCVREVEYRSVEHLDAYAKEFRARNRYRRIPCGRIVGFCMLMRRSLVDKIGLLDEGFGTGNFEDDDFCVRATLAGFHNMIAGDVFIHHYGSRSFAGNRIDYGNVMRGNRKLFDTKWRVTNNDDYRGRHYLCVMTVEDAWNLYFSGDIKGAIDKFKIAFKLLPQDTEALYEFVRMLIDAKEYSYALEIISMISPDPAHKKRDLLAGYCREGLGELKEASDMAESILAADPHSAAALNLKGSIAYKGGDHDDAQRFFGEAARADGSYGEPCTNSGVLAWLAGRHEEGLSLLERGFVLTPARAGASTLYHEAVTAMGEYQRAERIFREALSLYPAHKKLSYLYIDILANLQKYVLAIAEAERCMAVFGVDDGVLRGVSALRERIGPRQIDKGENLVSVSLCMIVKNEEKNLARCLHSISSLADEFVIVDTGSSDLTREIAAAFGAKVYEYVWNDDFSAARNYGISRAEGKWILILDADEVISPVDHLNLRKLMEECGDMPAAFSFVTRNYVESVSVSEWGSNDGAYAEEAGSGWFPSHKVRLFSANSGARFENPVHEFLEPSLERAGVPVKRCVVPVHHYGKLDEDADTEKGERYFELGRKKLEETGGGVESVVELAIQAGQLGRFDDAVSLWEKAIDLAPNQAYSYVNLSGIYIKKKDYRKAIDCAARALQMDPALREASFHFAVGKFGTGDLSGATKVLEELLLRHPDYPLALGLLSVCCFLTDERQKAVDAARQVLAMGFKYQEYLVNTMKELKDLGMHDMARALRENAVEGLGIDDAVFGKASSVSAP